MLDYFNQKFDFAQSRVYSDYKIHIVVHLPQKEFPVYNHGIKEF